MKKNVYCTAPWNGITIRENGDVKTCCAGKILLGNLNYESINDINNKNIFEQIKEDFLNGRTHKNCKKCQDAEKNGGYASLRSHYNKHYPSITDFNLKFIDVRWNNKCNLSCVYCSEEFSSTWEKKKNLIVTSGKKNYQDDLLAWILSKSSEISELMLVGGEPLLMKQNKKLIDNLANSCNISIITNLSIPLEKNAVFESLLQKDPSRVIWNVSLDNIKEQFEYVRSGADWEIMSSNLKTLIKHFPHTVSINVVYSILNALKLKEFVDTILDFGVRKFTFMLINNHDALKVQNAPAEFRNQALTQIESVLDYYNNLSTEDQNLYPLSGLQEIADNLKTISKSKFCKSNFLNDINKFDFYNTDKKLFKELWKQEYEQLI